jgi:ABC-2 type transport system permease protein
MTEARGEVYDIGYQRYAGPREGRPRARWALWANGVRTALGIGRGWPSKILPILLFFALMVPAVVFTLLTSTLGVTGDVPGHAEYYQGAGMVVLIFSAIVAPELLTTDRRTGVLNLYLVRPLTPTDYVFGRWAAFFSVMLAFVYLPQLALFIGLTLGSLEQLDYLKANWLDVPRFLGAGLALALFTSTLPLAVAAFTTRRAYAAAFTIGLLIIARIVGDALSSQLDSSMAKWFALIDIGSLPTYINDMIFMESSGSDIARLAEQLPKAVVIGCYLLLTVGPGALLWWRYQNLRV